MKSFSFWICTVAVFLNFVVLILQAKLGNLEAAFFAFLMILLNGSCATFFYFMSKVDSENNDKEG